MLQIHAYVTSETNGTKSLQIYNNENDLLLPTFQRTEDQIIDFDYINWSDIKTKENRILNNYNINTQTGKTLINYILKGQIQDFINYLSDKIDAFYLDSLLQIKISGLKIKDLTEIKSKSGLRVNNIFNELQNLQLDDDDNIIDVQSRSYIKPENLLKKYKVFNFIKTLPFINYENNENNENINCFYNYLCNRYNKIGKKQINKFNIDDGVCLENIINFCDKYKIKCYLYNIAGRIIYKNDYEKNKNHPALISIISNNHIYPIKDAKNNYKPNISKEFIQYEENENNIYYEKNNKIYNSEGWKYTDEIDLEEQINNKLDYDMFNGLHSNFNYKNDVKLIKSLLFLDEDIDNSKYEYDLNTAYYNVAYNFLDGEYPIFTCFDLWEKYNNEDIKTEYYYILSKSSLEKLKLYGLYDNLRVGFMIKYLLNENLINKEDIEYFKKPSYCGNWDFFKSNINNIIEKTIRNKLNLKDDEEITDEMIKKNGLDKKYNFYNGILGKTINHNNERFYYLNENEYELLNFGLDYEEWTMHGEGNYCIYEKTTSNYKYLNNSTLYNQIVEYTNLIMIKNICYIYKNTGLLPLKIKTDAIAYNREINVLDEYKNYFKLISKEDKIINKQNLIFKNESFFKGYFKVNLSYNNIKEIQKNINEELNIKENLSFLGAPGTGKTTKILNNHKYDESMTITNICSLNISNEKIKAETIYQKLQLYKPENWHKSMKKLSNKTVWIDEFSMVNKYIWNFILLLSIKYNTKFIITGDLNQISPVNENRLNINNFVLNKILGKVEYLNKDYRNDKEIIILRDYIINEPKNKIKEEFKKLDCKDDWVKYDRHICFTNNMRHYINHKIIKDRNLTYKINYDNSNKFKDMEISNNVLLKCRITRKTKNIYKGDIWRVIDKIDNSYKLLNLRDNKNEIFKMEDMVYFELGYAITAHSSQGLTIEDDLCIHEIDKMIIMDTSILYTAITRSKEFNKLHLYYNSKIDSLYFEIIKLPKITIYDDEDFEFNKNQELQAL